MRRTPSATSDSGRPDAERRLVSIVIPTLNEAERLPALLDQIGIQETASEVIVVDGGSNDETGVIAGRFGARLLSSPAGRGRQLAAGAEAASGDVLLFLHADSRLPPGALCRMRETLDADPGIPGGNFRLLFDGNDSFSRWLNGFYGWIRKHGFYYGDSAVFVRRTVYHAIGGMRPIALMEDYDFNRRLEKSGRTCCIANPPLVTSARRFQGRHPVRIVWGWVKIHLLFHLGVSPDRLARIYDSARRRRPDAAADHTARQDLSAAPLSDQS